MIRLYTLQVCCFVLLYLLLTSHLTLTFISPNGRYTAFPYCFALLRFHFGHHAYTSTIAEKSVTSDIYNILYYINNKLYDSQIYVKQRTSVV